MRKLAIFFTTIFISTQMYYSPFAQVPNTTDYQVQTTPLYNSGDSFTAMTNFMTETTELQAFENSDDNPSYYRRGFIVVGLDTPVGSFKVYDLGQNGQNIMYLGHYCSTEDHTPPPGYALVQTPSRYDPYMINLETDELHITPWYAESIANNQANFDWTAFLGALGGIGLASVGGSNMAAFQAWTLPAGSGLAILMNGPQPYPEGYVPPPPGC